MNRRQFLFSTLATGASLIAPNFAIATPTYSEREPLILHTETIRPYERLRDPDNVHRTLYPDDKPRLIDHGVELSIGDELEVRLITVDMGHHLLSVFRGNLEISRFRSWIVGSLMERGEPVTAYVTNSVGDELFRIDIVLNRSIHEGERIPLLDPVRERFGISAQLASPENAHRGLPIGWHRVLGRPDHLYFIKKPSNSTPLVTSDGENDKPIQLPSGLYPIKAKRKKIFNPSPWADLNTAVPVLTLNECDYAYLPWTLSQQLPQLLLRGECIEATIVGTGKSFPGEILLNLSLIA